MTLPCDLHYEGFISNFDGRRIYMEEVMSLNQRVRQTFPSRIIFLCPTSGMIEEPPTITTRQKQICSPTGPLSIAVYLDLGLRI